MASLFSLPDEIILTPLLQRFPGRDHQIRSLATLLHVSNPLTFLLRTGSY